MYWSYYFKIEVFSRKFKGCILRRTPNSSSTRKGYRATHPSDSGIIVQFFRIWFFSRGIDPIIKTNELKKNRIF